MNTALVAALREKYPDMRSALRRLGLDESLADSTDTGKDSLAEKVMRILVRRYGTRHAALRKLGMDTSMIDPSRREEEESSMRGGHFDPRDHSGGG
jgi:hypothetical protein